MEKIIDPIDLSLIKKELTPDKKICDTNKAGNEIYVFDAHEAPNLMLEVGRLREISFRAEGGCSGLSADIDEFDTMEVPYKQIIIWDPDAEAIIGGYRYLLGPDVKFDANGQPILATAHMFKFSEKFIEDYLPHTIELGRSFVTPEYQSSKAGAKALFAMDNLWDGISTVMLLNPNIIFLFGKMTMYTSYIECGRHLIQHFLWKHFPDEEELVRAIEPVDLPEDPKLINLILKEDDFKEDYKILKSSLKTLGYNIPPLVNSYMNTSPTMKMFGCAVNHEFGEVEETAIMVNFVEMYADKRDRHVKAYVREMLRKLRERWPEMNEEDEARAVKRMQEHKGRAFQRFLRNRSARRAARQNAKKN